MKLERIKYPDILRIAAIFFVILAHITSVGLSDYAVGSVVWIWSGIFNSISHWAVPVFFYDKRSIVLRSEERSNY